MAAMISNSTDPGGPALADCYTLTSCFSCLRDERCGWCADDNLCIFGDAWGPTGALECSEKWNYMSGQCYLSQAQLFVIIFASFLILVLSIAACGFYTFYRLKRQRLVAREYVRIFSEYNALHRASVAAPSPPTAWNHDLLPPSPTTPRAAANLTRSSTALLSPPAIGRSYYGTYDHDPDVDPWQESRAPLVARDSAVLVDTAGAARVYGGAGLVRSSPGRARSPRPPPSPAPGVDAGLAWADRREALLSQYRRADPAPAPPPSMGE
ncbi:hypothetical protein GGF31_004571 [Allomyces arbusculus]|nr:hypothetical protein GGF31_004571 [Allomyces arbusculus]